MVKPLPLFSNELDPKLDRIFASLCEDLAPTRMQDLRKQIHDHVQHIREALSDNEFLDLATSERVAQVLTTLLDKIENIPTSQHRLVVGAARYFIQENDLHSDLNSILGFDDDVSVLNYVLVEIGRKDLRIDL